MADTVLSRVGAPVVEAFDPLRGTPAATFHQWLDFRRLRVEEMLYRLTERWQPLAAFVEVNFMHPVVGPAGFLALATSTIDTVPLRERLARVTVIPFSELVPFVRRWEAGESVLVDVEHMPEKLARRYAATPIVWSLNVPVIVDGVWVALVGAANGPAGFGEQAVAGFEAMAEVIAREFTADEAWRSFHLANGEIDSGEANLAGSVDGKRFLAIATVDRGGPPHG